MTHGGASRPTSRGPNRTGPGGLAEFRECRHRTRASRKGAGRAFGPAARLLQASVLSSLCRLRTLPRGSLRVCGYNYFTEANVRSSYSLFESLHCDPRIKSKVLSSVFMTLHNQATTYLSSSISLKENYCCLLLTHHFLFPAYAVPSAWYARNRFSSQSHLPQLHPISHLRTNQGTLFHVLAPTSKCHLLSEVLLSPHSGFFPLNLRAQ